MRPIEQWTRDDLQGLVNNAVPESLTLDYKASPSLQRADARRNELVKDVSAFANSAGGILVYGIVEEGNRPVRIDDGVQDVNVTREWIEQILNSLVQPRISGLIIKEIDLGEERRAFAIQVPQATTFAPHQSSVDHKYYKRYNFQSTAMADYEIRDTLKRSTDPELFLTTFLASCIPTPTPNYFIVKLILSIGNKSTAPALYSSVSFMVDDGINVTMPTDFANLGTVHREERGVDVKLFFKHLSVPDHQPIYKEMVWSLGEILLVLEEGRSCNVGYTVSAPGCSAEFWETLTLRRGQVFKSSTGAQFV